eukprot:TRINITY_DN2036_c0_g2_i1.p1 TRINITY_DN2036_c0_g2~~TRINITY_DN2036_c0_g2_i1.p1  ORF type:complete len:481 (-),score=82.74 TRINITY_DN2036_c0_g2_i1:383-1783(-)
MKALRGVFVLPRLFALHCDEVVKDVVKNSDGQIIGSTVNIIAEESFISSLKDSLWSKTLGITKDNEILTRSAVVIITGVSIVVVQWMAGNVWKWCREMLTTTVEFDSQDEPFRWILQWLSDSQQGKLCHTLNVSTFKTDSGEYVAYTPGTGTHRITYCGKNILLERLDADSSATSNSRGEKIELKLLGRTKYTQRIIKNLVEEARLYAEKKDASMTVVYLGDQYGNWERTSVRPRRPLDSVILPDELKKVAMEDSTEFFSSRKWYTDRGLPYRRGYLFHGPPGTGKTSLVSALAGLHKINVYVVNIASRALDDENLLVLMRGLPYKCVLLMEDIDCVCEDQEEGSSGVTFSGLLNAIDGITASEGHLLIMTTNHVEKLKPVLIREGRIDLSLEFHLATKQQIRMLFSKFYSDVDDEMMQEFSKQFPTRMRSMAEIQGHLMRHKKSPLAAIEAAKTAKNTPESKRRS